MLLGGPHIYCPRNHVQRQVPLNFTPSPATSRRSSRITGIAGGKQRRVLFKLNRPIVLLVSCLVLGAAAWSQYRLASSSNASSSSSSNNKSNKSNSYAVPAPPIMSNTNMASGNNNQRIVGRSKTVENTTTCDPNAPIIHDHTTLLYQRPCQPITVAYAVSLIKCGDFQSTPEGLVDAALVMRHSVHQTSSRVGVSKYDYKMYAIVHADAEKCSYILKDAGFQVLIRNRPVEKSDIQGDFLRSKIQKEWCCGHDEFIKLNAYTLPEPVVVHVDMDFVFQQPMDDVFDALLFAKDSAIGAAARKRIARERSTDPWPQRPQAMMTRDWGQVFPGRKAGYQAGFIVLRSNPQVMQDLVDIIKKGDYEEGFKPTNGWGSQGYGAFVGAMAMQGLIAYYYDILAPDSWVELNQCRYNHMGMDVRFNPGGPGFATKKGLVGKCRNTADTCEDCMHTDVSQIYNIHYTQCRKPWMCIGEGDSTLPVELKKLPRKKTRAQKNLIPEDNVHMDHCMELLAIWHNHRSDLEHQMERLGGDNNDSQQAVAKGKHGSYKKQFFKGHCAANGEYLTLAGGHTETLKRIPQLYERTTAAV